MGYLRFSARMPTGQILRFDGPSNTRFVVAVEITAAEAKRRYEAGQDGDEGEYEVFRRCVSRHNAYEARTDARKVKGPDARIAIAEAVKE